MDSEERTKLDQIYGAVIRSEAAIKWLKENCDIQRICCEKHEERITRLEIHKGRVKGIFATISSAAVIITAVITFLISKFLWK